MPKNLMRTALFYSENMTIFALETGLTYSEELVYCKVRTNAMRCPFACRFLYESMICSVSIGDI